MKTLKIIFMAYVSLYFFINLVSIAWALELKPTAEKQQKVIPAPATEGLIPKTMTMLPDLVIDEVKMNFTGDPKKEIVYIRNIGADMPSYMNIPVRVQIYGPSGNEILNEVYTRTYGLLKGERWGAYVESPIPLGTGGVCNCLQRITVDPDNYIKESNENNNIYIIDSYLH